jgi:lysophospholipase L1-like esterase
MYTVAPGTLSVGQVALLQRMGADWPALGRYREDNAKLDAPAAGEKRVVFYGDSITDGWGRQGNGVEFFPGKPYVNRGISGQTTPQMLVRFRQDVVALKPAAVVILAGTNDIAGNTGPSTLEMIEDNFASMCEIAKANHIQVVLASVLPVSEYPWRPGVHPAEKIKTLNKWLKEYAAAHGATYLDYWSAMANAEGGLDKELATDGVHPTPKGYGVMAPLAEKAIALALKK